MQEVIGVKFALASKIYNFASNGVEFAVGDNVIVETARGMEYGTVAVANHFLEDNEIVAPLKEILRKATEKDIEQNQENLDKRAWAMKVCQEKISQHNLSMKLVSAEYTFDRSKVIFSFTAEGRVDFRDLVRDLASVLKTRIELRQIYERDDIKMRGALSVCGRVCCCASYLSDFEKVSVKMAKNQNLSLNPQKISGACGKLMCCLKYENDYYVSVNKRMPKIGAIVKTEDGDGRVESVNVLKCTLKAKVSTADEVLVVKEYKLDDIIPISNETIASQVSKTSGEEKELKNLE